MVQAKKRIKNDAYYTPAAARMARLLTDKLELSGTIFDPCAGDRTMANSLVGPSRHVWTSDLADADVGTDMLTDATKPGFWHGESDSWDARACGVDWVVTNPPFAIAPAILPLALRHSNRGIAMLLRITYIEPCSNRATWLDANKDCMRYLIPVNPRPKFRTDSKGTDSATVAWFVWDKTFSWAALGLESPFQFGAGWNRQK